MAFPNPLIEQHIAQISQRIYCEAIKEKSNSELSLEEARLMLEDSLHKRIEKIVREEVMNEHYGPGTKM